MRKSLILFFSLLLCVCAQAAGLSDRKNVNFNDGQRIFSSMLCKPSAFPVSFTYSGIDYKGFGALKLISRKVTATPDGQEAAMSFALDDNMSVDVLAKLNSEFGEVEYTVWFRNGGSKASGVLEKVSCADLSFAGKNPVLRGCLGDHENLYSAYEKNLLKEKVDFRSDGGRATHIVFPYFDLVHGEGGTMLALGWAGTWEATFESKGSKTLYKAQSTNDFKSVLLPGEKVRTALVVMLPYKGRNYADATNLWRDWFEKYNMPRADAKGDPIQPFSTMGFAGDTGLPNSDGSISERFYTWRRTLDRIVYEKVTPDFRWFDAGWYFDPAGHTVMSDWWGTVGTWQLDTIKWPGKTFRESNEACHKAGMKVFVWFEPERVTHVEDLAKNHGYNPSWAISNGKGVFTSDLGNPDCLKWTLSRITKMMGDNEVDLYREDNNSDPGTTWPEEDRIQEQQTGSPRHGITENKHIQGHYALWDGIIKFCGENGKCTFIDNCASGGGRNDIESLRRSIPFLRSDSDRTSTALRLSMTSTFNRWIPYCGATTKEAAGQLEHGKKGGSDSYITRASWLPVYNISENYTHDELLDYNNLRRTFGEWKQYRHLLTKDFYVLSPWHSGTDAAGWSVFAYNDRKTGESVVLAFRQENCPDSTFEAKLPYIDKNSVYEYSDVDKGVKITVPGNILEQEGVYVKLDKPKSSSLISIRKK